MSGIYVPSVFKEFQNLITGGAISKILSKLFIKLFGRIFSKSFIRALSKSFIRVLSKSFLKTCNRSFLKTFSEAPGKSPGKRTRITEICFLKIFNT